MTEHEYIILDHPQTDFNSVQITNDYMFSYVMFDPEICSRLLETIFPDHTINEINYLESEINPLLDEFLKENNVKIENSPTVQKVLMSAFGKKSIRMDVFLDDGKTIYNIEMQATNDPYLAKRSRNYLSQIDVNQLNRGESYDQLKPTYVIFICTYDPFDRGQYKYTFRARCEEEDDLFLEDESYRIFLNTKGLKGDISPKLKEVLQYMNDPKRFPIDETSNELIRKIDDAVEQAQQDDEWRRGYMILSAREREAELRGEAKGFKIGEANGIKIGEANGIKIGEANGIKIGEARGEAKGIKIGEAKGEAKGEARLENLIRILYSEGKDSLIPTLLSNPQKKAEYYKLYNLN